MSPLPKQENMLPFLAASGMSDPGVIPSEQQSLRRSMEDDAVAAFARRSTQPNLSSDISLVSSMDSLRISSETLTALEAPPLSSSRLMRWSPSVSAGGSLQHNATRQQPIGRATAPSASVGGAGFSLTDAQASIKLMPATSPTTHAPGNHDISVAWAKTEGGGSLSSPKFPLLRSNSSWDAIDKAAAFPTGRVLSQQPPRHPAFPVPQHMVQHEAAPQVELQMQAMKQAQDQYASALAQLTSAHSQVLAAAARLQVNGVLQQPQPTMMAAFAAFPQHAQVGGARRELF